MPNLRHAASVSVAIASLAVAAWQPGDAAVVAAAAAPEFAFITSPEVAPRVVPVADQPAPAPVRTDRRT